MKNFVRLFLNAIQAPDSVVTRRGGHRFRVGYRWTTFQRLDSTSVIDDVGIRFVSRKAFYNTLTGALDSLRLDAARISLGANGDGLGSLVTLPTAPVVTLGTAYTSLHGPMRDSLGTTALDNSLGHRYGYDDPGRLAHEITVAKDKGRDFTYDGLGRLTSVVFKRKGSFNPSCTVTEEDGWSCSGISWVTDSTRIYTYDAASNRTDLSGTYNPGNRIVTFAGFTFEHDLDGNVSRKYGNNQDVRYYWSAANGLDSVVAGTTHIVYGYDALGRLVSKTRNGVVQSYFLWDGMQLLAELNGTLNKRVAEYAYYPGIDQPMTLVTGDTAPTLFRYFTQDELGNVRSLLHDAGVDQQVTYDAWGKQQITGAVGDTSRLRWKGLMWEGDSTRLYYVRARWQDPTTGRFVSEDPIGIGGGLNLYAYAGNDPVDARDPTGLDMCYWEKEHHVVTDANTGRVLYEYDRYYFLGCVSDPGPMQGGGGGPVPARPQNPDDPAQYTAEAKCPALNQNLLRQLDAQYQQAVPLDLERGGDYLGPWSRVTLRNTGQNATQGTIDVPVGPRGTIGYWHLHQGHPDWPQGPTVADSQLTRNTYRAVMLVRSQDSLFVIYPNGRIVGCAR